MYMFNNVELVNMVKNFIIYYLLEFRTRIWPAKRSA